MTQAGQACIWGYGSLARTAPPRRALKGQRQQAGARTCTGCVGCTGCGGSRCGGRPATVAVWQSVLNQRSTGKGASVSFCMSCNDAGRVARYQRRRPLQGGVQHHECISACLLGWPHWLHACLHLWEHTLCLRVAPAQSPCNAPQSRGRARVLLAPKNPWVASSMSGIAVCKYAKEQSF